ncbi:MAG: LamG domain-containing protein, partial [Actinobacteria bacterium]|nr:LamG domain-containing protein [Actinomycetota bacterium]
MTELKLVRNAAGWLRRFAIAISVLMFSLAVAISNFGLAQSTDTGANSVIDYSLTFNEGRSDQVAEHPDGNFILGQTNVTWEAWIYQTSRNVAGTVRAGIFSKEMNFVLGTDSGRLWSAFQTGGNVWNDNIYTRAVVPLNTWTHVAFVKAGTTMRVFMNGQLVEERANAAPQTINGNEYLNSGSPYRFSIGRRHNGEAFVGRIDEVRVWESVVRTEAQIAANMHTKVVAGNASGLVGYWDFNEPPGTQLAYDRNTGGYTQNLSLVNSPTRTDVKTVSSNNLDTVITFPRTYLPGVGGWTV